MTTIRKKSRPTTSAPALLAVDVGNSETTLGVFQDDQVVLHWRLRTMPRTSDEIQLVLRQLLAPEAIDLAGLPSVIGSVVPNVTADFARGLERLTGVAPLVVTAESAPSMAIRYRDPSAVGADRVANAIAARERYGAPAIVVDVGTATTFDVVGPDGDFLGGAIALGLGVSAEELFRRAARLGRVELAVPDHAIGQTTDDGMRAGLVLGHAAMVDGMVSRILAELGGRAQVVATGGLVPLLRDLTGTIEHFDEWLTLHGLRLIHEALARPETLAAWTKKQEKRTADRARTAAQIEHEPQPRFEDEPEIDESEIHVVTGPGPSPAPSEEPRERRAARGRGERVERPARGQRGERAERAERPERVERVERAERAERPARPVRGSRGGRGRTGAKVAVAKPVAAKSPGAKPPLARPRPEPVPEPVAVAVAPEPSPAGDNGGGGRKRRRGRRGGRRSRR